MASLASRIARHSAVYAAGDLLTKSLSFLLIPLYTSYLSTADYGVLELLSLVSYIASFLAAAGVAQSITRYYYEFETPEERRLVVGTAFTLLSTSGIVVATILALASPLVSRVVFGVPDHAWEFVLTFASLAVGMVGDVPMTYLRLKEKSSTFAAVSIFRVVTSLLLNIVLVVGLGMGLYGYLAANLAASVATTVLVYVVAMSDAPPRFSPKIARLLYRYGLPMIGCWVGMYILNFADRYLLRLENGVVEVGVYGLAYKFGMLPNILVQGPFFMIWGVKQFQIGSQPDGNRVFGRIFSLYMAVQAFVWLGVCVVAPDLIRGVTRSAYHGASDYVPWIVGAYVFSGIYGFVQYGLLSRKSTGILAVLVLSGAAVNIGLNLWLIPRWGATGASISTLASFAYLAAVTALVSLRIYPIEFEWSRLAVVAAGSAVYCLVGLMIPSSMGVATATAARLVWLSTFPIFLLFSNFVDSAEREAVLARIRGLIGAARGVPRT